LLNYNKAFFILNDAQIIERLKRITSELKVIFDLSPDGFISFNEKGIRTYVNPALLNMTGLTRDSIEDISQDEFELILKTLCIPSNEHRYGQDPDILVFRKTPPIIVKRFKKASITEDGEAMGSIQYFRDITQEILLDKIKSDFLAMAAHEIRTPMANIQGYTELLLKKKYPANQEQAFLESILRQSTRLTNMINDLLDLSKIESQSANQLVKTDCNLKELINKAVADSFVNRSVKFETEAPEISISVDREKITRALINVFSNAIKYSDPDSSISIELKPAKDRNEVGIFVTDQGIGMTASQLDKLFTRFYRADTSGKTNGTGLGLCLVKEIMELHGGRIEVSSTFGKGSQINLWLPLNE
jgi:PAS domain S-box-containing protein